MRPIRIRLSDTVGDVEQDPSSPLEVSWPLQISSFLVSSLIHTGIVCALLILPHEVLKSEPPLRIDVHTVVNLKQEPIIYWARVPTVLPSITPAAPIGGGSQFQGETKTDQQRVVQSHNPESDKQLVWQPDKPDRLDTEAPLQNMVVAKTKEQIKPFVPPQLKIESPRTELDRAPEVRTDTAVLPAAATGVGSLPTQKPAAKAFVPPQQQPRLPMESSSLKDIPPELAATGQGRSPSEINTGLASTIGMPRRPGPFVPPPAGKIASPKPAADLAAPPDMASSSSGDVSAAIVGLNPANTMGKLPDGSRPAAFSQAQREGEPSSGPTAPGPVVPGVAVAGNRGTATVLVPLPPVSGSRSIEIKLPPVASTVSAPLHPASRTLPRAVEARFTGRIVYALVIPKPDLPEYVSNWTIWFAEHSPGPSGVSSMRPPAPMRKTVLVESASPNTGIEAWVQLAAVIDKTGKVASITLLPNRNPAVAQQAAADLGNWHFRPASRNGETIDVDVVIEVPFRAR